MISYETIEALETEFRDRLKAAVAAEREACARVAEDPDSFDSTECGVDVAKDIADRIRARGNT